VRYPTAAEVEDPARAGEGVGVVLGEGCYCVVVWRGNGLAGGYSRGRWGWGDCRTYMREKAGLGVEVVVAGGVLGRHVAGGVGPCGVARLVGAGGIGRRGSTGGGHCGFCDERRRGAGGQEGEGGDGGDAEGGDAEEGAAMSGEEVHLYKSNCTRSDLSV